MRTLKLLLLAVVLSTSTVTLAGTDKNPVRESRTVSAEIEKMLENSGLVIEDEFKVTVFFKLSEENEIRIRSIKSDNEAVNEFLEKRLNDKKVYEKKWRQGKLYELPVRVAVGR